MKSNPRKKFFLHFTICLIAGITGGAAIGFFFGDIARGVAFGIAFGVLLNAVLSTRKTGKTKSS